MNDTLDKSVIDDKYFTIKILGIFACLPALLFFIPFWLWPLKTNQSNSEDITGNTYDRELQAKENSNDQEQIGWVKGTFLTQITCQPLTNLFMGSAANAIWSTFLTISNSTMVDLGYSDQLSGLVGQLLIACGTIYAPYISYIMDTKKKMDNALKIYGLLLVFIWGGIAFVKIYYKNDGTLHQNPLFTTSIILLYLSMGFVSMSYQGLILNSCCIVCGNISEAVSTGNILLVQNVWGFMTQEMLGYSDYLGLFVIIGAKLLFFIMHMTYYKTEIYIDEKRIAKLKVFNKKKSVQINAEPVHETLIENPESARITN